MPLSCLRLPRRYVSTILRASTPSAVEMIIVYAASPVSDFILLEGS